ncbi:MAG TPA: cytochrome c [Candidatus Kryptonia bacterium]
MRTIVVVISVLAVEFVLLLILIYSGIYNVGATSPDPRPLRWVFSRTSDNSVEHYSKGIAVPALTDSSMIKEGFGHYDEMCVGCHGAPGIEKSEIGKGLFPQAPNLAHSAKEMSPAELFWVAKNGIKSTGMPAFAFTHSDQKIWAIVAFLETLPNMTPAQYAAMRKISTGKEKEEMAPRLHKKK